MSPMLNLTFDSVTSLPAKGPGLSSCWVRLGKKEGNYETSPLRNHLHIVLPFGKDLQLALWSTLAISTRWHRRHRRDPAGQGL